MIRKLSYLFSFLLFIATIYFCFDYYQFSKSRDSFVYERGVETTENLKAQIDLILSRISEEGERLAELLGENNYTFTEIESLIKESALSIPEIQGVTACYEPYALLDSKELYCPYYNKGTQDYLFVEKSYNYADSSNPSATWYTSVRDNGAKWVEPYFAAAAKDWYVDFGIPFYYNSGPNKGRVRGTVTMSFVCGGFKELVHSLSLGKTGFGMITSTEGTFLAHPINEYIGTTKLDSLMIKENSQAIKNVYKSIKDGKKGYVEFHDEDKGKTLFFYDNITSSDWGIGLMFYKNDLLDDNKQLHRKYILISIFLSLFFLSLILIYYNKDYLDEGEIWRLSILTTILLVSNLFLVGYLQHNSTQIKIETETSPISDNETLSKFVTEQIQKTEQLKTKNLISIPTGIFVQKLEFEDSYNLNIGGTIWQKYPEEIIDNVEVGFNLPQLSPFAEASNIEEIYRTKIESLEGESTYVLVGYDFRVTLKLNLKYADFPFDKRHISIEIVPKNNNDRLLFVPDLSAYTYTSPSQKSGLNNKIEISGSEIIESYFNYSVETYDADFGYGKKALFEEVPILHFNINLKRILLNSFVTYLIPIAVCLIMVFILIYACHKSQERQGIIESMAAFFFVLIFSHIDLRKEIVTADLIYIEYFYFVSYFMLIISTFNMITYTKNKSAIFDFNENQLFKAIFFPIFILIMLLITLFKFY